MADVGPQALGDLHGVDADTAASTDDGDGLAASDPATVTHRLEGHAARFGNRSGLFEGAESTL